jgi:hypothetical protein
MEYRHENVAQHPIGENFHSLSGADRDGISFVDRLGAKLFDRLV